MLGNADIITRVQTELNIYQKHLCVSNECIHNEVDKMTTLSWNLTFPFIYNLLESAFSKQFFKSIQIQKAETSLKQDACAFLLHQLQGLSHCSLFPLLSAWQQIPMKSTLQETLLMINNHSRNLCTLNKHDDE